MKDWHVYLILIVVLPIGYSHWIHKDGSGVGSFNTAWEAFLVLAVIGGIILIFNRLVIGKVRGRRRRRRRSMHKKNYNKSYVIAIMAIAVIVMGTYAYGNYDITIGDQKIEEIIPIGSITKTFDDISNSIPVNIEPKSGSVENTLEKESTQHFATITINLDKKPSGGATADITINKLQVVETDYYNIIKMNMKLTVHMELDDMQFFSPTAMWFLKNENGKAYVEKCHGTQMDMMTLRGDQNPIKYYNICYYVEKEFKKFDFHGIPITLE